MTPHTDTSSLALTTNGLATGTDNWQLTAVQFPFYVLSLRHVSILAGETGTHRLFRDQFAADGKTDWTGVRNFQARNNLRSMKLSDSVFYYHSVNGKAVVGLAKVTKEAFPDPTAAEGDWSAVELTPVKAIEPPVTLEQIKREARLLDMPLLKYSRLSVMKLTKEQFETILDLAKTAQSNTR